MKIYCQGQIIPEGEAKISATDHGFLYGAALFETFRTYGGEAFLLEEHLDRLTSGCRAYGIVPHRNLLIAHPPAYTALRETLRELLTANQLPDAVFRYTVSAGESPGGLPNGPYRNAVEIIFVRQIPAIPVAGEARLHILNTIRTEPEVFPRPKSAHYMNNLAAHRELRQRTNAPGDEGLLLTRDGRLSEGVVSNLFLIGRGRVTTPSPSAHILAGITRTIVLDQARRLGLDASETDLNPDDLSNAEAIFMTNSVRGITPISEVLDQTGKRCWQAKSADNETVKQLAAAYEALQS